MQTIKQVLMKRDGLTQKEAEEKVTEGRSLLLENLGNNVINMNFCEDQFGLEPDYLFELMGI